MAKKKISEFPNKATPSSTDLLLIEQTDGSYRNVTQSSIGLTPNTPITGATKTKITYDSKGLVTSGADATTVDIADSSNKRYVTDANLTVINNTSGTNSGNETASSIAIINNSATAKTALADGDLLTGMNSASSFALMKVTCLNLANYLLGIFNTVYSTIASPTFTGTVTTPAIVVSSETASRVAIIDASKNIKSADTATYPSLTELSYAKGVTSSIQTQINSKGVGTILGAVSATAGAIPYSSGVSNTVTSSTAFNYDNTNQRLNIGTVTPVSTLNLNLANSLNGATGLTVTNATNGTNASAGVFIGQSASLRANLAVYPSSNTYVMPGTSIPAGTKFYLSTFTSVLGDMPIVIHGTPIINIVGATSTNVGTRLDATGFRIGLLSDIHNANTALFNIGAGSTTRSPFRNTSGTLLTTALEGSREYNNSFYDTKNSGLRYGTGGIIFNSFADVGNGTTVETDLYSYTTPANTFATDGESLDAHFGGLYLSSATATRQIKVYFAGTVIFDSTALIISSSTGWTCSVKIIRSSSTTVRCTVLFTVESSTTKTYTSVGGIPGLTLSGTNILKITGQASGTGAATNDIVLKLSRGSWFPAANN